MAQNRRIYCRFCDSFFYSMDDYASHMETDHIDMIPKDMSSYQFCYSLKTGKMFGTCVVCHRKTSWNEKTKKYNRFCGRKSCKDKYIDLFKSRMIGKYGKINLLNDPDQQKKMLANRKISGMYIWSTNPQYKFPYTGTYELSFLQFLDTIVRFDPEDIIAPSPHTYRYMYNGEEHFYIPDFFIPSLGLEIEIKDHSNQHHKILEVDRKKEEEKDATMKSNLSTYNYLKIVDKHNERFLDYLEEVKNREERDDKSHIYMV